MYHTYSGARERHIAIRKYREYEGLKRAIFKHLASRPTFVQHIDSSLIEQAARLFADWLYIEELLSSDASKAAVCRYADALAKVHGMLISVFEQLEITPRMRSKIFKEISEDDEITKTLKRITGSK